ncbi:MAG: acetoacetate--CoA ligase, partial [Gammaproteobacteria bacterium WSBS_2016_MAG_OTU1]
VLDDNPAVGDCLWAEALASASPLEEFVRGDFNAPLVALFSSGTTGAPKCIVHRAGGVLLQHIKELGLHTNIKESDKVFYFTTCGWMMWNWLISSLALRASVVLFEGSPLHSKADILWDMVAEEQIAVFGVSAKYLDTMRKSGIVPLKTHDLSALRTICSTGAPLLADGFNYVYEKVKTDVQLASISGGTDIVSCFALGNPLDVVREGELQGRGLGLAVTVFNDDGQEILDEAGELVCTVPFPVMPLKFANDEGDSKYRAAYFEHFDGIWRHGDWAILTKAGGLIIRGRSDATLNPGGVRIGTAEIYRPVEAFEEVAEALAVGQEWMGDTRIVLFVRLATEVVLDEELRGRLSAAIRRNASPRHVPAKIIAVAELPRTRSGKIAEIAVRETIHNRPIKNVNALANPDSLECFRNLSELEV